MSALRYGAMATALLGLALLHTPIARAESLHAYAQECASEIGKIPAFDCTRGIDIPITVNHAVPAKYKPGMTCDRPALLEYGKGTFGQCTPFSKILNLSRGATQIVAFCRREYLRPERSPYYDEVDVVEHNARNGKTCWFHAQTKTGDSKGMNASRVPPPNERTPPPGKPSAAKFWWKPPATAGKDCIECHDAGPTMYSPWLGQEWQHVPTDPWGHYVQIGKDFTGWQSEVISTVGNTCTGCHRIGDHLGCSLYTPMAAGLIPPPPGSDELARSYPLNHWMPVDNSRSLGVWTHSQERSVQHLIECCKHPRSRSCSFAPIK